MKAGDTFLMPAPGISNRPPHLWIVVTDPTQEEYRVIIVSLTTLREQADQTVVLRKGEHPFIRWDSSVFYNDCRLVDARDLDAKVRAKQIKLHDPCSATMLKNIQDGLLASELTPHKVETFYINLRKPK
jgi:hypothetical protein